MIGAILIAAIGIALYWAMFYQAGYGSGYNERKAQEESKHYASNTAKEIERACVDLTGSATRECIAKIVEAERESQRNESDLAAQWKAADWVMWAGIIAGAQLLATAVGLYFVKRTLDATLEAVEDTGRATEAMERQNELAENTTRRQLWPYLGQPENSTSITARPEKDRFVDGKCVRGYRICITTKNFGQTPAKNVHLACAFHVLPEGQLIVDFPPFLDTRRFQDIPPGDAHTLICPTEIEDDLIPDLRDGKHGLYGFFRITYDGLGDEGHTLQFIIVSEKTAFEEGKWAAIPDLYIST